ncbi:MAG: hypothetical protein AB8G05_27245 [Oligoflexales bacterium]
MRKRKCIIIDDEEHYRESLKEFLSRDCEIVTFKHPDEFAEAVSSPEDLIGVYLVVLDYKFDTFDAYDKDIVTYIRDDLSYKRNLVLWSLQDRFSQEFIEPIDAVLPKRLMTLPEIEKCIEEQKKSS